MTTTIAMPQLNDSMTSGVIAGWIVADGSAVEAGDAVVDVESDKASVAVEAPVDGVIRILAETGSTVEVGHPLAAIEPAESAIDGKATGSEVPSVDHAHPDSDPSERAEEPIAPAPSPVTGGAPDNGAVAATPLARRNALRLGVDLSATAGTGPRGRVMRDDVYRAAGLAPPGAPSTMPPGSDLRARTPGSLGPEASESLGGPTGPAERTVALTALQQVVARRMAEAKSTVPHFQVQLDAEVSALMEFRSRLRETGAEDLPSLNDLLVKAVAVTLTSHPLLNGSYRGDHVVLHDVVNIGVAVAAERSLVVPTIRDADRRSLGSIARESRRLVAAVRDRRARPEDLDGATFTLSNLGMYGMAAIYPVINPPQAAILGVGAARPALGRGPDGELVDLKHLTLTLSCDHRVVYGEEAARFLADLVELIQSPLRLAL